LNQKQPAYFQSHKRYFNYKIQITFVKVTIYIQNMYIVFQIRISNYLYFNYYNTATVHNKATDEVSVNARRSYGRLYTRP